MAGRVTGLNLSTVFSTFAGASPSTGEGLRARLDRFVADLKSLFQASGAGPASTGIGPTGPRGAVDDAANTSGQPSSPICRLIISRGETTRDYPVLSGHVLVGGNLDCDLIIPGMNRDDRFKIVTKVMGGRTSAFIEVLADNVVVGADKPARDTIIELTEDDEIRAGACTIKVKGLSAATTDHQALVAPAARRTRRGAEAWLILAGAAVLVLYGLFANDVRPPSAPVLVREDQRRPPAAVLSDLADAFRSARIQADVSVERTGRAILVDATKAALEEAGETRLRSIIATAQRSSQIEILDVSRPGDSVAKSIAAIALSPVEFVIGKDGHRYRIGDAISRSWIIKAIGPKAVTLARGEIVASVDVPGVQ